MRRIFVVLMVLLISPAFGFFCSECGKEAQDSAKFCSECGKALGEAAQKLFDVWKELEIINDWETFSASTNLQTANSKFPEYKINALKTLKTAQENFPRLSPVESKYVELMGIKWAALDQNLQKWNSSVFGRHDEKLNGKNYLIMEGIVKPIRNRMIAYLKNNKDAPEVLEKLKSLREKCLRRISVQIVQKKIKGEALGVRKKYESVDIVAPQQIFVSRMVDASTLEIINITPGYQQWFVANVSVSDLEAATSWRQEYFDPFIGF